MGVKFTRFFTLTLSIVSSALTVAQTKVIPYQQLQSSTGMFFGANMSVSTITVTFAGPSNRWIALGFGVSMTPCDALIYSNGQASSTHALGWNDYYCANTSASNVTNDSSQDWTIVSNNVASGQRTVVATRALNTNDANDVAISFTAAALNIVWARSATADYTIAYHGSNNRGNGISLPWQSQPLANFTVATTTVCAGSSVTFSNTSTGGQTTYTWNFSGANLASSSATNPVVTYTAPGTYSVALTAANSVGTSSITQVNYITVNPTVVPIVTISQTGGGNPICSGAPATFTATYSNGGPSPAFQWKVNGSNVGTNSPAFSSSGLTNPSSITCVLTANSVCAVPANVTSSAISLTVNSSAAASVSIALTGGTNPMCNGSSVTFSATPGNGGSSPSYQWKVNALNAGSNSPTFNTNTLINNDVVSCQILSSSTCAITGTAVSTGITASVSQVLIPSVSIALVGGSNPSCAGSNLQFTTSASNGGSSPSYQWKVNGNNAGTNSPVFTSSTQISGNSVSCVMTSNSPCSSPATVTSSAITLTIHPIPPAPTITPSGSVTLCSGKGLTLVSSATSGNNWSTGANTTSITVNAGGNYSVTQTINNCTSAQSSVVSVIVIPSPTVSLGQINPLCKNDGALQLTGSPSGGVFSGAGISGNAFDPLTAGTGTHAAIYSYTAPNSCQDTASISITVLECSGIGTATEVSKGIRVFPNPTSGTLYVQSSKGELQSLRLVDTNGKIVMESHKGMGTNATLNISGEPKGIYFLEVELTSGLLHLHVSVDR